MCYSARVRADFRQYQRFGGKLDIHAFVKMFVDRGRGGDLLSAVAKPLRNAFMTPRNSGEEQVRAAAIDAYSLAAMQQEAIIAEQTARLLAAQAKLAIKPTKTAATQPRASGWLCRRGSDAACLAGLGRTRKRRRGAIARARTASERCGVSSSAATTL